MPKINRKKMASLTNGARKTASTCGRMKLGSDLSLYKKNLSIQKGLKTLM